MFLGKLRRAACAVERLECAAARLEADLRGAEIADSEPAIAEPGVGRGRGRRSSN